MFYCYFSVPMLRLWITLLFPYFHLHVHMSALLSSHVLSVFSLFLNLSSFYHPSSSPMIILVYLSTEEICIDLESYKVEGPIEEISRKFAMNQVRADGQAEVRHLPMADLNGRLVIDTTCMYYNKKLQCVCEIPCSCRS